MKKVIKIQQSDLTKLVENKLTECSCESVGGGNLYLAKLKWEKSTPEERIVFLNLNGFGDNFANATFDELSSGLKKLVGLKMDKQTVDEDIEEESNNLYWRDISPDMEVVDKGASYVVGRKGIYWYGHEAKQAQTYLDKLTKKTKLRGINKPMKEDDTTWNYQSVYSDPHTRSAYEKAMELKSQPSNTDGNKLSLKPNELKFLKELLEQVEPDNDEEAQVINSLKQKF